MTTETSTRGRPLTHTCGIAQEHRSDPAVFIFALDWATVEGPCRWCETSLGTLLPLPKVPKAPRRRAEFLSVVRGGSARADAGVEHPGRSVVGRYHRWPVSPRG